MRLHEFIAANRAKVLEEWVAFASTCLPGAHQMDIGELRDHASEMIAAIIADLQAEQSETHQRLKSLGERDAPRTLNLNAEGGSPAQFHGVDRAREGFTIVQLASEFRALRASILRIWLGEADRLSEHHTDDLMRFNEAIDQALAESVGSFARVVDKALSDAREKLEERVASRTRQLAQANEDLLVEIGERQLSEVVRVRLLQQVLKTQEEEQQRIARELHDQLGQKVAVLSLYIRALRDADGLPPYLHDKVVNVEKLVRQLDDDVDFLVWQLRPTALDDLGLVEAIDEYVKDWAAHAGISTEIDVSGMDDKRLSGEAETVLYRVLQEALTNIAKHAHAHNVAIRLTHGEDGTVLNISDDGVGFDLQQQLRERGRQFGLHGMHERAALVGGSVTIDGRPGQGTAISVRIPLARSVRLD